MIFLEQKKIKMSICHCLDILKSAMNVFGTFIVYNNVKRREFYEIQLRVNQFINDIVESREGHLSDCNDAIRVCMCKDYILNTPRKFIEEIVEVVSVPYAISIPFSILAPPLGYPKNCNICLWCIKNRI